MKAQQIIRTMVATLGVACAAFSAQADESAAKSEASAAKPAAAEKATTDAKYKPLAEARAQIDAVIADPAKMTEVIKTLSPEDQKTFVADVNAAIDKMPGSDEDKTAKFLNVNKAALKGAAEGNMANILAVTFATVPPASLTVISEDYSVNLFNRNSSTQNNVSNANYEKTATEVVGKVETATTGSDDAGVRNTLAILMFVKADNGQIDGLSDRLVDTMPDSTTRTLAKTEWIPAAMAKDEEKKSYDSMLAYADAGKAPNIDMVIVLAGPQIMDAALVDITSGMDNDLGIQTTPVLDQAFGGFDEARVNAAELQDTKSTQTAVSGGSETPRTTAEVPWNPEYKRSDPDLPSPGPEPEPYPFSGM